MTDQPTKLPYHQIIESLATSLEGMDLETISYVDKTIREKILDRPEWKHKIKLYGLAKFMEYNVVQWIKDGKKSDSLWASNKRLDLFEKSLCTDDGLIKVYVPMFFISKQDRTDDTEALVKLGEVPDVKPFLERRETNKTSGHDRYYLYGSEITVRLRHVDIMKLLIDLSEKCILQYKKLKHDVPYKVMVESNEPVFAFTFEYINYMELVKRITRMSEYVD